MGIQHDVIIVGAGFSGLAAARMLDQAGISFKLLEARDRLGGRTYTKQLENNRYVDLGGQWIGQGQDRMYALAQAYNIPWYDTYNEGKNIIDLNGKVATYTGLIPRMDIPSLINLDFILRKLEAMAKKIPLENPWNAKQAIEYDAISLEAYIRKLCYTNNCYKVIRAGLETVFACELNELSLLHALFYIRSGRNLNTLLSITDGAQQHRLKGGMQTLAKEIAKAFNDKIHFNHAVNHIDQKDEWVNISGNDFSYSAKKVIMAIPPVLIKDINFNPNLPLKKSQLLDKLSMGIVGKVFGIYEKPFWRKNGYSGQVVADELNPFQTFFDASPANAEYGVLLAFCLANRARAFFSHPQKEREQIALQHFEKYFGAEAAKPIHYIDHCWAEEAWSKGCFAALYPTGAWTNFQDTLAEVQGHIHWAGTETSKVWYGYIEGAVRAGERAAAEIISKMIN
jgi:monoamine oxidase